MAAAVAIQGDKSSVNAENSGPADPYAMRHAWESFVVPAARAGKLDKIPTKMARNARERSQAKAQNAVLSRKSIGAFSDNYDLIDWSKKVKGDKNEG